MFCWRCMVFVYYVCMYMLTQYVRVCVYAFADVHVHVNTFVRDFAFVCVYVSGRNPCVERGVVAKALGRGGDGWVRLFFSRPPV